MSTTSAAIVETPDQPLPFKVTFSKDGTVIAERPVTSRMAGEELIANLLPLLRRHDEQA